MALNYKTRYPAQTDIDAQKYPFGKARNISTQVSDDGTPWERDLINDQWGFLQAMLSSAGLTPSGVPDTADNSQYLDALSKIVKDISGETPIYSTVDDMIADFSSSKSENCITLAYNKPVVSYWARVTSGLGDMSDGTIPLTGGDYAKIQILPVMDVRAFGAWGDYNPITMPAVRVGEDYVGYTHDDSNAFINAIRNCDHVVSRAEDSFAIAKHVNCSYDDKTIDFSKSKFYWFGKSGAPLAVGRDRAMFEIHGSIGSKFQESGPWASWREGADTFPSNAAQDVYANEFILLSVGQAPTIPEETYMIRPSKPDYRTTDLTTRFQSDYRLGWTHDQATFKYFNIYPIKNTTLKLGYAKDMTDYDYDERDGSGNRMSASTTAAVYAYNVHIECYEADNWQYPVVMTYVTTDCEVRNIRLLESHRESLSGIFGWGIAVQWNNALRPRSYNLAGQGNRRILDYTQAAYAYAENVGGESTRDGETTTHGVYEHNLTYVNTRGFMSFAASGPDFGETSKNITVLHHHGSDVFAVRNVQNLSLTDVVANSIRVNSVGLRMDNCSLYDSGDPLIDNLCQISNFSKAIGKPYPNNSAVISNSSLGSNGAVFLVDQDIADDEYITFSNCDLELREGDFAGPANIIINGGTLRPKNGTGQLVRVNNPTSVTLNNVKAHNVAFGVLESIAVDGGVNPCQLTINGGKYVGVNFDSAFWANRDSGADALTQGNSFVMDNVRLEWDYTTIMEDQLGQRNPWWYTKITNCDIKGVGEIRLPKQRSPMRFGDNTVSAAITLSIDEGFTDGSPRLVYNTLVAPQNY